MSGKQGNNLWRQFGKKWRRSKYFLALTTLVALFILGRLVEVDRYLQTLQEWLWGFGPWGPLIFILIYLGATLLLLPGVPFTIAAAFLFGTRRGFFIMVAGSTIAAIGGFLISRYLVRDAIEERFGSTPTFHSVRDMMEKNHRVAIPFVRLMPFFPFAVNNYALGLTRISFWSYLFYSELVLLPMNAVLVYGAYAIYRAAVVGEMPWLLIGITTGAGFLILGLAYLGKRMFGERNPPNGDIDQ